MRKHRIKTFFIFWYNLYTSTLIIMSYVIRRCPQMFQLQNSFEWINFRVGYFLGWHIWDVIIKCNSCSSGQIEISKISKKLFRIFSVVHYFSQKCSTLSTNLIRFRLSENERVFGSSYQMLYSEFNFNSKWAMQLVFTYGSTTYLSWQ